MAESDIQITIGPEDAGARLDAYLAAKLTGASRAQVQRAIEGDEISVNDRPVKSSYRLHPGDRIEGDLLPLAPLAAQPEPIPLQIIYEDDDLIVIDKPAGMVVHPGAGVNSGTLANALVYHLNQQQLFTSTGDAQRPGIVHRLDVGTSGLIVAAKTELAQLHLAAQFAERSAEKMYIALVYGQVANDEGRIDAPIGRDPRHRTRMAVRPSGLGRVALTRYRVCRRLADFTLLEVEIKTGRTHQIRVHLAHIKHPVVGDATYDGGRGNSLRHPQIRAAVSALGRPYLHAARLAFDHPAGGRRMEFSAELPEELKAFLTR